MRILVITEGLEPSLQLTVIGLAGRGHRVRVLGALSPDELDPVEQFRLGRSLRVSGGESGGIVPRALRVVRSFARSATVDAHRLRAVAATTRRRDGLGKPFRRRMASYLPALAERADVVYFESANLAVEYAGVLDDKVPKVVMCSGSDIKVNPDLSPRFARALPAVFAGSARVFCRSQDLQQWAVRRGAPPGRTEVLYAGVDTTFFSPTHRPPTSSGALRLVSVGRLHWVKAYQYALHALALARSAGHDVTYTIVGADEGDGAALVYASQDLDLGTAFTRAGPKPVAGVRAVLARADAFVVSSVSEGVSRAALEAMAMGLPVITTDAGGMSEAVDDGVEGFVVPRRDARALADAIVRLTGDPVLRMAMGERARTRALQFDARKHLNRLEQVLGELVQAGADRSGPE